MATTALAQEKVWLEKPSYDKAERLHFERLAKVSPQPTNKPTGAQNQSQITSNPPSYSKSKKSKKNKSPIQGQGLDKGSTTVQKSSNQVARNAKTDRKVEKEKRVPVVESTESTEKIDKIDSKEENGLAICLRSTMSDDGKKYKPKEAKEKKNKADKSHRNKEQAKNNTTVDNVKAEKEQPLARSNKGGLETQFPASGSLANEVAKARQHIKESLQCMDGIAALAGAPSQEVVSRIGSLEKENQDLRNIVAELKNVVGRLEGRVKVLEGGKVSAASCPAVKPAVCPAKPAAKDEEDDVDLFGSDSEGEDAEAAKIREERLAAYAAKKSKKPVLIAKSNIILDVKPWDDETDMKAMEVEVRKIVTDGLLWGAAKLVPLAYGIHKLQISCVVEDDKVSIDWLTEQIESIEDFVQSVDIAAFNKV